MRYFILTCLVIFINLCKISGQSFVKIQNGSFVLNGANYYPIVLNYIVDRIKNNNSEYWLSPHHSYGNTNDYECNDKNSCQNEIRAQLQMIKDMGFNSIRIGWSPSGCNNTLCSYFFINGSPGNEPLIPPYTQLFSDINDMLSLVNEIGLKVILLCGGPDDSNYRGKYADYLEAIAINFKDNPAILAYDLFNEPTFASKMISEGLSKSQICSIVNGWIDRMKYYDSNHLITIGFANSEACGDWDPQMISVDFASFHPYGSENDFGNEIFWYSRNIKKPWIIGETGFAADPPLYEAQRSFAQNSLERCINCGGKGYSWWQYQDVWWGAFNQDYIGLLNHNGITQTSVSGLYVQGTLKPAASEFQNFASYSPTFSCPMYSNYYNMNNNTKNRVSGRIINSQNGSSIEGVVILGRDADWNIISKTFSKSDGSFTLITNSDAPISIINYSYLGMENGTSYLSAIDNSNPLNLDNITVGIGQSAIYNSSNSIVVSNFTVLGNGTSGGSAELTAPLNIKFTSGTKVAKGGRLKAIINRSISSPVQLTPLNSCSSLKSENLNTNLLSAINKNLESSQEIKIYPNPSDGIVNIQMNSITLKKVDIYDAYGKKAYSLETNDQLIKLDLTEFTKGLYVLKIKENNSVFYKKMILE